MEKILTIGDRRFTVKLMKKFGIKNLNILWSDSKKQYPDIWCFPYLKPPKIVVTAEWTRQNAQERRKRLLHEVLHLIGYEHGKIGKYDFNTVPSKDSFSKAMYEQIK